MALLPFVVVAAINSLMVMSVADYVTASRADEIPRDLDDQAMNIDLNAGL